MGMERDVPATEPLVAVLDRAHPFVIEWLCSAERAASTRAAFGEDANKVAGDRRLRDGKPPRERPLGAAREQGHRQRLHSSLGNLTPVEYERRSTSAARKETQVA
jgi:hypothetical protein